MTTVKPILLAEDNPREAEIELLPGLQLVVSPEFHRRRAFMSRCCLPHIPRPEIQQ